MPLHKKTLMRVSLEYCGSSSSSSSFYSLNLKHTLLCDLVLNGMVMHITILEFKWIMQMKWITNELSGLVFRFILIIKSHNNNTTNMLTSLLKNKVEINGFKIF